MDNNEIQSNETNIETNNIDYQVNQNNNVLTNVENIQDKDENVVRKLVIFIRNNKKICLILLAVLILIITIVKVFSPNKSDVLNNVFSVDKPIPIEINQKYGFINTKGKTIIEPTFLEASSFYGDYSVVKLSDGGYNLINDKGDLLIKKNFSTKPNYISEYGIWLIDYVLYDMDLKPITSSKDVATYEGEGYFKFKNSDDNTVGIMNYKGKKTYTYKLKSTESYFGFDVSKITDKGIKEHYCRLILDNSKYGIVNCDDGKAIYDFTEEFLSVGNNNLFYISKYTSGKGIIGDYLGKVYVYPKNNNIVYYSTEKDDVNYIEGGFLKIVNEDNITKYYDINNNKSLDDLNLDNVKGYDSSNGYTIYYDKGKYGIKKNEDITYTASCDNISFANDDLYKYMGKSASIDLSYCIKDNKVILLNAKNGKEIISFDNSKDVTEVSNSTFLKITTTGGTIIYNLISSSQIKFSSYDNFNVYENYVIYKKDGKRHYYNYKLEEIYEI